MKSEFTIRNTRPEDLPEIQRVYACAREFMRRTGNPNQWGDNKPLESLLVKHIREQNHYCVEADGRICGAFAFISGEDPTYGRIDDGAWLNDLPYCTIHCVASDGRAKGVLGAILEYCNDKCANLRIDTHNDNKVMQHCVTKYGFTRCGIIYLEDGDPRIAYQRYSCQG